ncbi:MAG: hypothetical protein ACR2G6_09645 [Gemmatimonadaceae bacterium]
MSSADLGRALHQSAARAGVATGSGLSDPDAAMQVATRKDGTGHALLCVLGVIAAPGTETRHVWMRIAREDSDVDR